jgi:rhodanese-related sulfurtransferase
MPVKRVTPPEAKALLDKGWKYVDVRSIPEFDAGHPVGAYNVPIAHQGPRGMSANAEFAEVVTRLFKKDEQLVIGCKSGGRSTRAAQAMEAMGFTNVVEMTAGMDGWAASQPVEKTTPGRSYEELKKPRS